jgi:hypothetical protein
MERWNLSAKWDARTDLYGVYDHVGQAGYANSIQLAYLDSQSSPQT